MNFETKQVAAVFDAYPDEHRENMLLLRQLIFDTAESIDAVGELEETLKWGEPAYLTSASKSGTTIRIDWKPKDPDYYAIYVHCQTTIVSQLQKQNLPGIELEDNRAILFAADSPLPVSSLRVCIAAALTYHVNPATST